MKYTYENVPTPVYVVDRQLLEKNLQVLEYVQKEFRTAMFMTGCDSIAEIDKDILV